MSNIWKEKKTMDMLLAIVLLVLVVVFLLTAGNRFFGKGPTIVSADMDKIMSQHPAFKEAMLQLQSELQSMNTKLSKLEGEAKASQQQEMRKQIQQLAFKLQEEAMAKVMEDVRNIAKSKGYDYIFDSKSLLVGGKDITDEILSTLVPVKEKPEDETSVLPMIPVK